MYFQQAGNAAYGAAKGGVIGLSQSLAKEFYADDIRVNCIGSGLLRKPLAEGAVKPVTGLRHSREVLTAVFILVANVT